MPFVDLLPHTLAGPHAAPGGDGPPRLLVRYDDFDGISLLADRAALLARYRDHDLAQADDIDTASVAANPTATLLRLANLHEVIAWGTHQSPGPCLAVLSLAPFTADELHANGVASTLTAGCLALAGELLVGAWHSFTYGCDYRRGELDCPRVELPSGLYRVTVHRPFRADEDRGSGEPTVFLIHLERLTTPHDPPELVELPGADGWL